MSTAVAEEVVEKSVFLVVEDDRIIASNVQTGQFFDFDFSAKEKVQQQIVANGVAIVVTNQRYAGIGVFSGGWQSIRRIAGYQCRSPGLFRAHRYLGPGARFQRQDRQLVGPEALNKQV
jgi:hypothetical protein